MQLEMGEEEGREGKGREGKGRKSKGREVVSCVWTTLEDRKQKNA